MADGAVAQLVVGAGHVRVQILPGLAGGQIVLDRLVAIPKPVLGLYAALTT